jgi:hypothetical protein
VEVVVVVLLLLSVALILGVCCVVSVVFDLDFGRRGLDWFCEV